MGNRIRRTLRLGILAATVAMSAATCSDPPDEPDDPGTRYASIQELAAELDQNDLCDEFEDNSRRVKTFGFGNCQSKDADGGKTWRLLVTVFPDEDQYTKHQGWDASGCGGPMVYGPNWRVGPLGFGEIPDVLDAVGGEIVGFQEEGDC